MRERVETDVLIVGSGFSGLGMGIGLRQAGLHDFVVLEQAEQLGGTWRDNHYPGVACDVPAPLYSYSFEPNPHWSKLFAPQREILAYLNHCADKYGVRQHIRFGCAVTRASFDEVYDRWEVDTSTGQRFVARVLVTGTGGLSQPGYPQIAGRERFAGKTFHTARWDDDYPLEGKTVAVIGTGASAIQVVPSIVARVKQLKLFQRTPAWVLPKPDLSFDTRRQRWFERNLWGLSLLRRFIYWTFELRALGFLGFMPSLMNRLERRALEHLTQEVRDPALRAKLTPDYRIGCKRLLISSDYYAALQRDNAELVSSAIREIRERSIVTEDGCDHPVDAIVFATGFQTAEFGSAFPVIGRDGRELNDSWRGGPEAYLGSTVAGFPNLFIITGPNTGLGHSSMVFIIESQIRYVLDALRAMRERDLRCVEVKRRVQDAYNRRLQARLPRTVWASGGCLSWYYTRSGKNTTLWPGFTFEFRWRTRRFDVESYLQTRIRSQAERERRVPESVRPSALASGREHRPHA